MQNYKIYANEWIELHPYSKATEADWYYIKLANGLLPLTSHISTKQGKELALYLCAYLEDLSSDLGLWNTFTKWCFKVYQRRIPFYDNGEEYYCGDINIADICFILWYTLQCASPKKWINPYNPQIIETAKRIFTLLDTAFDESPENIILNNFFNTNLVNSTSTKEKLQWLITKSYLIRPSVVLYLKQIENKNDIYQIACGPIALFPHEWIVELTDDYDSWIKLLPQLSQPSPAVTPEMKKKNQETYKLFTTATHGQTIVYLDGYMALRHFLTKVLLWPDDDNHTLPHLKDKQNFILMVNPEKGILLACDIAECICDPVNTLYDKKTAQKEAFSLLCQQGKCPSDLLIYCIQKKYLPDAGPEWVQNNMDFIARCMLDLYYRGD